MKKLLLVFPALLLLLAPAAVFAHKDVDKSNHGSDVREVARENKDSELENHKSKHDEDESDDADALENEDHHRGATVAAQVRSDDQLKIKINIKTKNNHGATVSATHSATPSAHISVSGPLDQVIKALEQILEFLKNLF